MRPLALVSVISLLLVCACGATAEVTLVEDGQPVATIVHLGQPGAEEAALELQHYLHAMSGAELPIETMQAWELETAYYEGRRLAVLVVGEETAWQFGIEVPPLRAEGFYQMCDGSTLLGVLGKDPQGLMFGVCDLLEQLGVRWYFPGELGEEIPQTPTIRVSWMENAENPAMIVRNVWYSWGRRPDWQVNGYAQWRMRNKMGGRKAQMGHALARIVPPGEFGETHPEYFRELGGQRVVPRPGQGAGWQPCTSNPEVVNLAVEAARAAFDEDPELWSFSISPNDGYGWCECAACRALDPPEAGTGQGGYMGRRMLIFANQVAEQVAQTHPDRYVAFYAYAGTVEPPTDVRAHPNVVVAVAPYGRVGCGIHAFDDPRCEPGARFRELLEGWAAICDTVMAREYFTGLVPETEAITRAAVGYSLAENMPWYRDHHVVGISSEANVDYGSAAINFWLAAKLMWNPDEDVAALLDDWYSGMYGPAAATMREYFETIITRARERQHQGPLVLDEELPELRAMLDEAAGEVETDRRRGRVEMARTLLDYVALLRAFVADPSAERRAALMTYADAHADDQAIDYVRHVHTVAREVRVQAEGPGRYTGPPLVAASDEPLPEDPGPSPRVRGAHGWVVLADRGDDFTITLDTRRVGGGTSQGAWVLLGPDGAEVASGACVPGRSVEIPVTDAEAGLYNLVANPDRHALIAACDAPRFALYGTETAYIGPAPRQYFLPEPGATHFEVQLVSSPPGELGRLIIYDPDGAVAADRETGETAAVTVALDIPPQSAGRAWSLEITRASRGTLEDNRLVLGAEVIPLLATDPSRLMVPR